MNTFIYNFKIAYEAILANKLRAILTSLGIICGVASVIAMLAIGKGAEQAILEKMKILGTNNIIIKALDKKEIEKRKEKAEEESKEKTTSKKEKYTPGLTLKDAEAIRTIVPNIHSVCSEVQVTLSAMHNSIMKEVNLIGIEDQYFKANSIDLAIGSTFNQSNYDNAELVCIIGSDVKYKLFPTDNPIGRKMKVGNQWLTVVGLVKGKELSDENIEKLNVRNFNLDIYIPINTLLLRFANRNLISKKDFFNFRDDETEEPNKNQIDRIIVNFNNNDKMVQIGEIITKIMSRRHNGVEDFEVVVPEQLLEQEQSTQRIFNIVLSVIASISLIVGGIGIMNIMLASILERTKEIGIRKAIGATRKDILLQFLSEAVAISLTGGILGIIIGISISFLIEKATGIITIVGWESVMISFLVSISVGLIFGIAPARKASMQDTIELLRYE